jgi:DNA-binding NarL/FixJ family response regulator
MIKKSVLLIEDDARLRSRLVNILNSAPDIECRWAFASAEEVERSGPSESPAVVLLDINLPGISGIEYLPAVRRRFPDTEVLMLTAYEKDDDIFNALKAGASGYLVKSSQTDVLFDAIREVLNGGAPFSSHIARKVVEYFQVDRNKLQEDDLLSAREREVLDLLAAGHIYKTMAEQLQISIPTIRTYLKRICTKLHVKNRSEAIAKAFSQTSGKVDSPAGKKP